MGRKDSLQIDSKSFLPSGTSAIRFRFIPHLDYSASAGLSLYTNSRNNPNRNNFTLNHIFRYQWIIDKPHKITLTNTLFHRLGLRCYFDSITEISFDENTTEYKA